MDGITDAYLAENLLILDAKLLLEANDTTIY